MTTQTPFLLPFQVDQLSVNSFEIRDAAGHLICHVTTHDAVVEREKLVAMFAAVGEMRDKLAIVDRLFTRIRHEGFSTAMEHADIEVEIRALLARVDGTEAGQ